MAASPQEAAHVPQLVEDARTTSWTNVSALSILMFDYVATFDDEVTLFWGAPWTISKFLYLLNRYFTILLIIFNTCAQTWHITSASTCSKLLQVQCFGAAVTIATVDAILMLRVWILYEKSRKVLWFLSSTFSAELIAMLILSFYYEEPKFVQVKFVPEGCYSAVDQRHFTIFVIGPLIVSLMMFTMTLHCCLTTLHASRGVGMPLFELFLRDGVLYFLAASPVLISGLLIWHFARPALSNLIEGFADTLYSIVASRVLINIRNVTLEESRRLTQESAFDMMVLDISHVSVTMSGDTFDQTKSKVDGSP